MLKHTEKDPSKAHILHHFWPHLTTPDALYLFLKMQTHPESPNHLCNLGREFK